MSTATYKPFLGTTGFLIGHGEQAPANGYLDRCSTQNNLLNGGHGPTLYFNGVGQVYAARLPADPYPAGVSFNTGFVAQHTRACTILGFSTKNMAALAAGEAAVLSLYRIVDVDTTDTVQAVQHVSQAPMKRGYNPAIVEWLSLLGTPTFKTTTLTPVLTLTGTREEGYSLVVPFSQSASLALYDALLFRAGDADYSGGAGTVGWTSGTLMSPSMGSQWVSVDVSTPFAAALSANDVLFWLRIRENPVGLVVNSFDAAQYAGIGAVIDPTYAPFLTVAPASPTPFPVSLRLVLRMLIPTITLGATLAHAPVSREWWQDHGVLALRQGGAVRIEVALLDHWTLPPTYATGTLYGTLTAADGTVVCRRQVMTRIDQGIYALDYQTHPGDPLGQVTLTVEASL